MIIMGWVVDQPLDLNLHVFETTTFIMTVITVSFVVQDGQSNWLKGMTLTLAYCILAASFFFHKVLTNASHFFLAVYTMPVGAVPIVN